MAKIDISPKDSQTPKEPVKVAEVVEVKKVASAMSIGKVMNKKFGERTLYQLDDKVELIVIPSLSYTVNHCSGIGGIAAGYIHEIYGDTGSGKTALTLGVLGNAQRMGMRCLYIDAENRLDIKRMQALGVNTKDLLISHNNIIEQIFDIIVDVLQSGEIQFVLLDSLATLMSEKEFESDMDANDMGRKAQAIGKGIKKVVGIISQLKATKPKEQIPTFIMTNQIRTSTSQYGPSEAVPGGMAPKFFSSQRIRLQSKHYFDAAMKEISKGSNAELDSVLLGAKIFHKHVKNTFAPPQRSGNYNLYWDARTIDHKEELVSLALMEGIITQVNSSYYEFEGEKINGIKNMVNYIKESKTAIDKIAAKLNLPKLWVGDISDFEPQGLIVPPHSDVDEY